MKTIPWSTAAILIATVTSITVLTILGLPIPAAISGILGAVGAAFAPSLRSNGDSIRPPKGP